MVREDPSLVVEVDEESGQTVLKGIGELHLEVSCDIRVLACVCLDYLANIYAATCLKETAAKIAARGCSSVGHASVESRRGPCTPSLLFARPGSVLTGCSCQQHSVRQTQICSWGGTRVVLPLFVLQTETESIRIYVFLCFC